MLKRISTLIMILALASCGSGGNTGSDGYKFGKTQYEKSTVQINVVTYKTQAELVKASKARGVDSPDVVAFSVLRPPFDTCTIHMIDPKVKYQPEFVGHEFLHCVYGQFHSDNNSFS